MSKLVLGAFADQAKADEAIMELEQGGVPSSDFSLIAQEDMTKTDKVKTAATESSTARTASDVAAVGGAVGGLAGLIGGAIATAGMFVAGPVVLLAGLGWVALTTAVGGAVGAASGGVVGALVGMGVPEDAAKRHESVIKSGGVLLGVEDNEISEQEIRSVFDRDGAEQVATVEHSALPSKLASALG